MKPIIEINNLSKQYKIGKKQQYYSVRDSMISFLRNPFSRKSSRQPTFFALKNISFTIDPGEVIGIIGPNGAGKSTLLKVLSQITPPTSGQVTLRGRVASLLEVGTGFHQELTGRENIFLNGAILGMTRSEVRQKLNEIINFAEISKFIDTPVKHYSSGMYVRLAFAVAAHLEPDILLVDEVLAVGDASFQKKCLSKMKDASNNQGRTVILVSHNMNSIRQLCNKVVYIDKGKVIRIGSPESVISTYLSTNKTNTHKSWRSSKSAPGDSVAHLKSAKILNEEGVIASKIEITRPIYIEVTYVVKSKTSKPSAGVRLKNQDGLNLFSSFDFHHKKFGNKTRPKGEYTSTCIIPGNLLSTGTYLITLTVVSFAGTGICHADAVDALSFEVVDYGLPEGARGNVQSGWPGIIRPKLDWGIKKHSGKLKK